MTRVVTHPSGLIWYPDHGYGRLSALDKPNAEVYDGAYFEKYVGYARTVLGERLNAARVNLVEKYAPGYVVVDLGIGCGDFVEGRNRALNLREMNPTTLGFDVNPAGVKWLRERGFYFDPYQQRPPCLTCWDSLEHLEFPDELIRRVEHFLFVSIPIFRDRDHVLRSKHFRTDEHFWYFSQDGFLSWMHANGFICLEQNRMETELGREDIGTFVFRRER